MTDKKSRPEVIDVKALLAGDDAFIRTVVWAALQEVLEAEMTEAVGAGKGERTANRVGYRSGYKACRRAGRWPEPWDRRDLAETRADLAARIAKWQAKYAR